MGFSGGVRRTKRQIADSARRALRSAKIPRKEKTVSFPGDSRTRSQKCSSLCRKMEESGASGTTTAGCKSGFMASICSELTKRRTGTGIAPPDENSAPVKTTWPISGRDSFASEGFAASGGKRIAAMNMTRPKIEAIQLCGSARGRRTRAAPRNPRQRRKANQECGLRRGCTREFDSSLAGVLAILLILGCV